MATEAKRTSSFLKAGTCTTFHPSKINRASRKSRLCFSRFLCRFASSHSSIALYRHFVYTCQEDFCPSGESLTARWETKPSKDAAGWWPVGLLINTYLNGLISPDNTTV